LGYGNTKIKELNNKEDLMAIEKIEERRYDQRK
jgi:hypothetical protein